MGAALFASTGEGYFASLHAVLTSAKRITMKTAAVEPAHPVEKPLMTVITVCYNSGRTIERALFSVASQSWPKIEHIVIDGGSTDGTRAILSRFQAQLAHLVSEPDNGIYDAMNKGLDRASGDIVCFLNADDEYASPDVLTKVANEMSRHALDGLLGDVAYFAPGRHDQIVRRYRSDRFRPDKLAYGWMPAHPALFLRRQVYRRVGKFRTDYRIAGDFEFIVRAFSRAELRYRHLPEILVNMQMGGASTAGLRATLLLNREVLRACRENGIATNMIKILSKYPYKLLEFLRK
jgi:glycosyltransferase involved in cell wall biosynthesis